MLHSSYFFVFGCNLFQIMYVYIYEIELIIIFGIPPHTRGTMFDLHTFDPTTYCFSTTGAALSALGAFTFFGAAAFLAFGAVATLSFFTFGAVVFAFLGAAGFFAVAVLAFFGAAVLATVAFFTFGAAPAVAAFLTGAYCVRVE